MILSVSCSSLMNFQEQPVVTINDKEYIYKTSCSGMVETIGTCHEKAKRICKKGYGVLQENLDASGIHREIVFQCK